MTTMPECMNTGCTNETAERWHEYCQRCLDALGQAPKAPSGKVSDRDAAWRLAVTYFSMDPDEAEVVVQFVADVKAALADARAEASWTNGAAGPTAAEAVRDRVETWLREGRCGACGWTLAKSQADGCVPGDCSYRPVLLTQKSQRRANLEYMKRRPPADTPAPEGQA